MNGAMGTLIRHDGEQRPKHEVRSLTVKEFHQKGGGHDDHPELQ